MGLDIYLLRKVFVGAGRGSRWLQIEGTVDIRKNGTPLPIELNRIWEVTECVGYWRKFSPLHQWMVDNALEGQNDCLEHIISAESLSKLKKDCEQIINGKGRWIKAASAIFPALHFERADSDQLEEFLSEIRHTYRVLEDLPPEYEGAVYYYRASW